MTCPKWPDGSDLEVVRSFEHYYVPGATFRDFFQGAKVPFECGPKDGPENPEHRDAVGCHEGQVCSYYQYVEKDGACRIVGVHLKLFSRITVPRWTTPATSGSDAEDYALLRSTVDAHEENHFKIARKFLDELHRRVWAVPPQPNCPTLTARIDEVSKEVAREQRKEQSAFDAAEYKKTFEDYRKAPRPQWTKHL